MNKSSIFSLLVIVAVAISALLLLRRNAGQPDLIANRQHSESGTTDGFATAETFMELTSRDPAATARAIRLINQAWHPGSSIMLFESVRIARSRELLEQAAWLAESKTGQSFGRDMQRWNQWIWNQVYDPHPQYAEFKSKLYSIVDRRFAEYFQETERAKIRLDEVVFGGVRRDAIPPLKNPAMVSADEAAWLDDSNVVFGVILNGDARCYPKRILAWHEMFKDTIGGESVCGVY